MTPAEIQKIKDEVLQNLSEVDSMTDYFTPLHIARNIVKTTPELRADKEAMLEICRHSPTFFEFVKKNSKIYVEVATELVKNGNYVDLYHASPKLTENKEFMLAFINNLDRGHCAYSNLGENLVKDNEILIALANKAEKQYSDRYRYELFDSKNIKPHFENNKEVILQSLSKSVQSADLIKHISSDLRFDRDFALQAIKKNPLTLEHFPAFTNDKEIVMEAVKIQSQAIQFASDTLKNDKDIVLEATTDGYIYTNNQEIKNDRDYVLNLASGTYTYGLMASLPEKFRDDKEIVSILVAKDTDTLKHVSERLRNDPEVLLKALEKQPSWGRGVQTHAGDKYKSIFENADTKKVLELLTLETQLKHKPITTRSYLMKCLLDDNIDKKELYNRVSEDLKSDLATIKLFVANSKSNVNEFLNEEAIDKLKEIGVIKDRADTLTTDSFEKIDKKINALLAENKNTETQNQSARQKSTFKQGRLKI